MQRERKQERQRWREISEEAVKGKIGGKVRRFICSKLPNTWQRPRFQLQEGERRGNTLTGRFIYRKLQLLVELVALVKSYKAIRLF